MKILISGASVAGPVLAYWLHRYGFEPTVVERTLAARHGLGGHAVDLYAAAAHVTRRMGCWDAIEAARTRLDTMTVERFGRRPVEVDLRRMYAGISSRHVEILRGELTRILYGASRDSAEYLFGDSIADLHDDGVGVDVTFDSGLQRRFDLVIGADGLHSNVRRLVFGPEQELQRPLGGYLAVFSMPDVFGLGNRMLAHFSVGKLVGVYGVHQTGQVRAGFLFRGDLTYDHRDKEQQKALLVKEFRNYGWKGARATAAPEDSRGLLLRLDRPDHPGQLAPRPDRAGRRRRVLPRPGCRRWHQPGRRRGVRPGRRAGEGRARRTAQLRAGDPAARRQQQEAQPEGHGYGHPQQRAGGAADARSSRHVGQATYGTPTPYLVAERSRQGVQLDHSPGLLTPPAAREQPAGPVATTAPC
ncbi:FAD-dependent monooxygenase [Kribbella sp. WER1]